MFTMNCCCTIGVVDLIKKN
uniref:Uncharacterized protein n=1 Tax=Rhizophora mucronata TaxID=61149 RepID=A0A2P2NP32_RHIMU